MNTELAIPPRIRYAVAKHRKCNASLGEPLSVFISDGCYCVRWSNGEYYHYTAAGTWF